MKLQDAIEKVEKDNNMSFGDDLHKIDFFFDQPNVELMGSFGIKDLKLIIDVMTMRNEYDS